MDKDWILITGAGGGIGSVLTPYFLEQGYGILALSGSDSQLLEQIQEQHDALRILQVEYTSEQSMTRAFAQARKAVPRIRGVIHLVGGSVLSEKIRDLSLEQFREVVAVNLDSAFLVVREAFRWMSQTGGGNIVLFGSTTGTEPSDKKMAYGVSKAAVHNLTLSAALEGSEYGIITNTIAPSYVMTPRHEAEIEKKAEKRGVAEEEIRAALASKNPLKRILNSEDLIPMVELLLTTSSMQGQVVRVDLGQVGI